MFNLPLPSYQRPSRSKSDNKSRTKRKRKGSRTTEEQISQDAQVTDGYAGSLSLGSLSPLRRSAFSAVLTPDEIHQYAVAGQRIEDELPGYPFPHADFANRDGPSRFDYDLRQQLKPGHASPSGQHSPSIVRSLHQQHLAVMTTILHRSLFDQDFVRAGRALGMILRDEIGGKHADVRAEGRWGIGAEILMRQNAQRQHGSQEQSSSSSSEQNRTSGTPRAWFSRKGFDNAKKYYERLIVQYPFYKQHPEAVSALDFYPAMFGLWIYVVHQEAKLKSVESKSVPNESEGDDELRDESASPVIERSTGHQPTLAELSQAREIADRMDSAMSALPYREDADLIDLRRMVQLWVHDLDEALAISAEEIDENYQREDTRMQFLTSGVTNVSLQGSL